MRGWRQALDLGVEGDHGLRHGLAGGVGVEPAADGVALCQEWTQPAGIGPGTGRGNARELRMEDAAAKGVDGRFTQDDGALVCIGSGGRKRNWGNGKEAQILLGAWGHPPPGLSRGAPDFGADRSVVLSPQHEDGIGAVIGVKGAALKERINQAGRQPALFEQIVADTEEVGRIWSRQVERRSGKARVGLSGWRGKMAGEPVEGFPKTGMV